MWFNILPAFFIVAVGVAFPGYGSWWFNYLLVGNHFRRNLNDRWDRQLYQRDLRVTGNPYKVGGLETIKDDE